MSSRKAEIQAAETAVASPLRRSSRKTSVNSPAPATVTTKAHARTQAQNEHAETKPPKTRRASLSQENNEKDETAETKPAVRGRRASTSKEEPDKKPEPAKTRSRRSSAAESSKEEEPKSQTVTRRRRSNATEETSNLETIKPVRTRRGSAAEKTEEEPKKTKATKHSVKEETLKEEPIKRNTRSRRNSVDKAEEVEVKDKKPTTRGRRSSTEESKNEPEPKAVILTPVKQRRRLSITENVVNLEPIEEIESEVKGRNSTSPTIKDAIVNLTPIKSAKFEVKENLNLSVINELSFTEESTLDENRRDKEKTPRRSPRLNGSGSASPKSGKESVMEENRSPEQDKVLSKDENVLQTSKKLEFNDGESLESDLNAKASKAVEEEPSKSYEENVVIKEEKLLEEVENSNISLGSDGSFKFHLNMSIPTSHSDSIQEKEDDLNSSKSSNTSDKENVDMNTRPSSSVKKPTDKEKQQIVDDLTNTDNKEKSPVLEEVIVARVSNVFQPKMRENSFVEPMDVDEDYSVLEQKQETLGKSPVTSVTDKSFKDTEIEGTIVNKNLQKGSVTDKENDSVDESFYLHLSVGPEEKNEEAEDISNQVKPEVGEDSKEADKGVSKGEHCGNDNESNIVKSSCAETSKPSSTMENTDEISKNASVPSITVPRQSKSPVPTEEKFNLSETSVRIISDTEEEEEIVEESKNPEEKVDNSDVIEKPEIRTMSKSPIKKPGSDMVEKTEVQRASENPVEPEQPISLAHRTVDHSNVVEKAEIEDDSENPVEPEQPISPPHRTVDHSNVVEKAEIEDDSKNPALIKEEPVQPDVIEKTELSTDPKSVVLSKEESGSVQTTAARSDAAEVSRDSRDAVAAEEASAAAVHSDMTEETTVSKHPKNSMLTEESISTQTAVHSETIEQTEVSKDSKKAVPTEEESASVQTTADVIVDTTIPKDSKNAEPTEVCVVKQTVADRSEEVAETEAHVTSKSPVPERVVTDNSSDEKIITEESESLTSNTVEKLSEEEHGLSQSDNSEPISASDATTSLCAQNLRIADIEKEVRRRSKSPQARGSRSVTPTEDVKNLTEESEQREIALKSTEDVDSDKITERENSSMSGEQSKDLVPLIDESETIESKAPESSEDNPEDVNDAPIESLKSGPSDDYDFEIPSDEEETEKTNVPECEESTLVTSFMATSQHISEGSTSIEMETVIIASKKEIKEPESKEEKYVPDEDSCQIKKGDISEDETEKSTSELNISEANERSFQKQISGEDDEDEVFKNDDREEPNEAADDESVKELDDCFKDELQDNAEKVGESPRKSKDYSKRKMLDVNRTNESEVDVDESYSGDETSKMSVKKKLDTEENRDSEKLVEDTEEKIYSISSADSESPLIKIKAEEKLDSYKKDVEKVNSKSRKKLRVEKVEPNRDSENQEEEEIEEENSSIPSANSESPLKKSKTKKKSKKKRIAEKQKEHIEKDDAVNDDEIEPDLETSSPKKESKSKHLGQKRKSDENTEDVTKSKKQKKSHKKMRKEKLRNTESNEESPSKKPMKKSPSSKLDEFLYKKMAEMDSDDESYIEEEEVGNSEERNEFVYTMAEEGEEDTPSEDSNAIIDEGESINSTDTERGNSDNDEYENDSFICDDEDEELLSGEEYDLSYEKKDKKKKSRIIQLDKIIKAKKKNAAAPTEKKRSRIITVSDSSESDEELRPSEVDNEGDVKSAEESSDIEQVPQTPEKIDIEGTKSSPTILNVSTPGAEQRKRLASITIHENINVKEIQDTNLTERISHLVDSFCNTMRRDEISEISMNVSIECTGKDEKTSLDESVREKSRRMKRSSSSESSSEQETAYHKPSKRLSASLCEPKKKTRKRKNKSSDEMETMSKKKKTEKKKKKKVKSPKRRSLSEDNLMKQSFGLINQLITDVRNRPRRTIKPSTMMDTSWFTEEVEPDVRPSTSAFDKQEKEAYKAGKVHPKDFRSQMLNDPTRVRRIETKKLLKKKGVYL